MKIKHIKKCRYCGGVIPEHRFHFCGGECKRNFEYRRRKLDRRKEKRDELKNNNT